MKLYTEGGNKINYFHIDIREEIESIMGTGIISSAIIVSPDDRCAYEFKDIEDFYKKVRDIWNEQQIIYHSYFDIIFSLYNGKQICLNTGMQVFKAYEI